jgi:hypothetical protein
MCVCVCVCVYVCVCVCMYVCRQQSHYVAQAVLELGILLPHPPSAGIAHMYHHAILNLAL